jgi:hypothetical protein
MMLAVWILFAVYGLLLLWLVFAPERKVQVYENIAKFRTHNHHIRTWIERDHAGPPWEIDVAEMTNWVSANRDRIDKLSSDEVCRLMCSVYPRISAIECLEGYGYNGSLLYPRWP